MDSPTKDQEETQTKDTTMSYKIYDDIDMRNASSAGYWKGTLAGVIGTLIMCMLIGLYLV